MTSHLASPWRVHTDGMALRWATYGPGVKVAGDASTAVHVREVPDGVAAGLLLEHGRHRITLEIVRAERNRGFMYLGVLAADGRVVNAKIVDFPIETYSKNKMLKKSRDINNIYSFTPFQKHKQNPIL